MSAKIWVLGDAVVDLLPDGNDRLLKCPGGAPANVAVGVARLGGDSGFIGRVGDDPFGKFMYHTLMREKVDTHYITFDSHQRTSTVVVNLDANGERSFTFMVRPSADLFLQSTDLPVFARGEWLHVCSIALSEEPSRSSTFGAMEAIRRTGGYVSFDPNIREDLWADTQLLHECLTRALELAHVVKLSEEELMFISGMSNLVDGIATLATQFPIELLLVTQGKNGVLVSFQGNHCHYPVKPVVSIDTTGAGDAFVAGLLYGLSVKGMPSDMSHLAPVIALAQRCGALVTMSKGAMTALPYQQDIEKYV